MSNRKVPVIHPKIYCVFQLNINITFYLYLSILEFGAAICDTLLSVLEAQSVESVGVHTGQKPSRGMWLQGLLTAPFQGHKVFLLTVSHKSAWLIYLQLLLQLHDCFSSALLFYDNNLLLEI